MSKLTQNILNEAETIVLKIGTHLIVDPVTHELRQDWFEALAEDIKALVAQGKKIVIVTSGAIALGREELGLSFKEASNGAPLSKKQAAAAAGTRRLINAYGETLEPELKIAPIWLTYEDIRKKDRRVNARNTIKELLDAGQIVVINENDTVAIEEISFGDNDPLSAMVAKLIGADALVLCSTVDGYYTADPHLDPNAKRYDHISEITEEIENMAGDAPKGGSTGGGKSKALAAKIAAMKGREEKKVPVIVAKGKKNHFLSDLMDNPDINSTVFSAQPVAIALQPA